MILVITALLLWCMSVGIVVKEDRDGADKVVKHLRMTESKKLRYQTTDKEPIHRLEKEILKWLICPPCRRAFHLYYPYRPVLS